MIRRPPDPWLEHPALDYLLTTVVIGTIARAGFPHLVAPADKSIFYQTLAGVSGGLLALGSISVTVVFTVAPTPRLQMVLDLVGQRLRQLIFSCLTGLVMTTAGALGLFLLNGASHAVRDGLTAGCVCFMTLRFARLWWLLHLTLKTLVRRTLNPQSSEAWEAPPIAADDYRLPQVVPGRFEGQDNPP